MLGSRLTEVLQKDFSVYATTRKPADDLPPNLFGQAQIVANVNTENLENLSNVISEIKPLAVLNCIGIIKQLPEGKDPVRCIEVNALFPHQLAQITGRIGTRLIHFSTDCVFSGNRGQYRDNDLSDADDFYGRSKALGEVGYAKNLTLRSSIIGPELNSRRSLVEWFISQKGKAVKGFSKAIYSGLTTYEMSVLVRKILTEQPELSGIWNVASKPISKLDLLSILNRKMDLGITIEPSEEVVCDRSLDGSAFGAKTGYQAPDWDKMIQDMVNTWPKRPLTT